jgi:hypothetical protein
VLLNSLDLNSRDMGGNIVMEGEAVKLIPEIAAKGHPLHALYSDVRAAGLIDGVCRACSTKLGVADAAEKEGLALVGTMSGHPSMADYIKDGFEIVTM